MSRDWIDQAAPIRAGEDLDRERLADYLARHLVGYPGRLEVEQFPSGYSNLTYLLRLGEAEGGERELVLRRPPFGSRVETAHDMSREYRILARLHGVYSKAPRPVLFCDDEAILGAPFYIMERLRGIILRAGRSPQMRPAPQQMAEIAEGFVDSLVELHRVDASQAGLADFGRPEGYVGRQVAGWTKRWRTARTDDIPEMDEVATWLGSHQPGESGAVLIHNDFKYDNVVLDPGDRQSIIGVLDWEMATLGDPLMDLGTTLGYWVEADDPPEVRRLELSSTTLEGNPGRAGLAERYAALAGRSLPEIVFYYAFGLFKIAVIIQQIYYRFRQGLTADPRFAALGEGVHGCALMARQAIDKGRLDRLFEV